MKTSRSRKLNKHNNSWETRFPSLTKCKSFVSFRLPVLFQQYTMFTSKKYIILSRLKVKHCINLSCRHTRKMKTYSFDWTISIGAWKEMNAFVKKVKEIANWRKRRYKWNRIDQRPLLCYAPRHLKVLGPSSCYTVQIWGKIFRARICYTPI